MLYFRLNITFNNLLRNKNMLKKFCILTTMIILSTSSVMAKSHNNHSLNKSSHKRHSAPKGLIQEGIASYYASSFHGKKTASGSIFNMYAMTAASNSLPLGTAVKVTNKKNERTVIVKITDTGGFGKYGRIIDLSKGAAEVIGMGKKCGLSKVTIQVI